MDRPVKRRLRSAALLAVVSGEAVLAAALGYLLVLLAAATGGQPSRPAPRRSGADPHRRYLIIVPAHNEEELVGATVNSLRALDFPKDRFDILVVADNCSDRTATIAEAAGARVAVRDDPTRRGKGYALAWALSTRQPSRVEAVVVVDADCYASPNLLHAIDVRLSMGVEAVQTAYVMEEPGDSSARALRSAAFWLINYVRPLGRSRLGVSCGILGSGFALTDKLLERHPWQAFGLAEDREYHARLVAAGERVVFAPEASVTSVMPTTFAAAREQNRRWEQGNLAVAGQWPRRLLGAGLRHRDPRRILAAFDLLVPAQSLLLATNVILLIFATFLSATRTVRFGVVNLSAQALYVFGGLCLVRAPWTVYRAFLRVPGLVAWKVSLQLGLFLRRGPREWVGTRQAARRP